MKAQLPQTYTPNPDLLASRVILVTGAGDGIGHAAATTFAAHGATVVLLGRTLSKLEAVYDEIMQSGHPEPGIYPMDMKGAQPQDYDELAERLASEFGHLDGLLHNAALLGSLSPLDHCDVVEWWEVIQVNLHGPFFMTRACLPLLKKSQDASIIFTSCSVGRKGRAYWGAYGVSKFAIEGMMQILAEELDANPRIRVNSLNPGPVRTRLRAAAYPAEEPGTLASPEAVMASYLFLMGPDSREVNGQALDAQ